MYIRPGENEYNVHFSVLYCWMKDLSERYMNEQEQEALKVAVYLLKDKRIENVQASS